MMYISPYQKSIDTDKDLSSDDHNSNITNLVIKLKKFSVLWFFYGFRLLSD